MLFTNKNTFSKHVSIQMGSAFSATSPTDPKLHFKKLVQDYWNLQEVTVGTRVELLLYCHHKYNLNAGSPEMEKVGSDDLEYKRLKEDRDLVYSTRRQIKEEALNYCKEHKLVIMNCSFDELFENPIYTFVATVSER